MKGVIVLLFMMVGLSGCPENKGEQSDQEMRLLTISKGSLHGAGQEGIDRGNHVITDAKSWNLLLSKLNKVNTVSDDFEELPVDFSKEVIIACFDTVRNTGGFSLSIDRLKPDGGRLGIMLKKAAPGPTDFVTMSITQPYHIVKILKTDKEIVFIEY